MLALLDTLSGGFFEGFPSHEKKNPNPMGFFLKVWDKKPMGMKNFGISGKSQKIPENDKFFYKWKKIKIKEKKSRLVEKKIPIDFPKISIDGFPNPPKKSQSQKS